MASRFKHETGVPITWHTGDLSRNLPPDLAAVRPQNTASEAPLASLIDIASLRALLDDLSALVGIPTALLDLEGNILQSAGWQKACTAFHRAEPNSSANCTESDLFLASHLRKGEFVDYKCKNGLWDVVTPVFVADQHLGNLYCGQFFYDDDEIDDAFFLSQAERFGYDPGDYLAAIHDIPRFSRGRVRQIMGLIVGLASYLSSLSLSNLRLTESRSQMETLLQTLPDPVWVKDRNGVFLACNRAFQEMLGATAAEILGKTDDDFLPADLADFFRQKDREAMADTKPRVNEEWLTHASSGQQVLLETIKTSLPGPTGTPIGVLGIARDITERKRVEDNLHLMSRVFCNSGEAIVITDAENRILAVNSEFVSLTGYSEEEVIGQNPRILSAGGTPAELYQEMWTALEKNDYWQGELWDRRKTGEAYPKRLAISVVRGADGEVVNYIGSFEDITDKKAAEDRIRFLAHHDALTGLPNRLSLNERLEQSVAFARRMQKGLAVMLLDLDNFKSINDTLGHAAGDQLLVQVAQRLQSAVRGSDIVARLGGDEFVVVLTGIEDPSYVTDIAVKVVDRISAPYDLEGKGIRTTPSVGICFYPRDATEVSELIKNADIAMYRAKASGRSNFKLYAETMKAEFTQRVTIENELETALREGHFVLYYQPQVESRSGRVIGMEALVRWAHPVRGLVLPGEFIAIAEESGLILPLGAWVLEQACRQLADWHRTGHTQLHMAVNLSALQFQDPRLPDVVRDAIERHGVPANCLHLEITESMAMRNPDQSMAMMEMLTGIGVKLVMDDFGTGYSSLAYLKLFPLDIIKIDRSFVKDIESDENDAAICEMTMLLAQKLGMQVVAEGVETTGQLEFLSQIGCHWIQGYLFGRPAPGHSASGLLHGSTAP